MLKIILIEDEPAAMRYLKSIIDLKCSGFEVIAEAENGSDGLDKIRKLRPDVVISDIRMAVMDGLELVSRIKTEFPCIRSIIVSGYQDFEYAKSALKSGVVDYLLKPVNPVLLKNVLDGIKEKLDKEYYSKRVDIFNSFIKDKEVKEWQLSKYLPFSSFSAAILRKNGLPSRFSSKHGNVYDNIALEVDAKCGIKDHVNIWALPGRDEQELIFFHTKEISDDKSFREIVGEVAENICVDYKTVVFTSGMFPLQDSGKAVLRLYRILDNSIVIGVSQNIVDTEQLSISKEKRTTLDDALVNRLRFLLSNAMFEDLRKELSRLFKRWENEGRTQLWVEGSLRQLLGYIEKYSPENSQSQNYDLDYMLDEALYYSTTFNDLMINVWEIIEKFTKYKEKRSQKVDTPTFIRSIEQYVRQNITECISLQSVCTVFGISQPYLSRLFRKHKSMSFNEYLTMLRIDMAKKLIRENPNIPLKDVAAFVGYCDPFYFSRVFRSVTGMPPSEYTAESSF